MNISPRKGVLLVNLGTPKSSEPRDVFRYLNEFLTDKRVIDFSWLKRQVLVRGIIVPFRYKQSARQYQALWTREGSPLLVHSRAVQKKLQEALGQHYQVKLAMRYQEPSIPKILAEFKLLQLDELVIVPLFPQYASATTGSVFEKVMEEIKNWVTFPKLTFVSHFYNHPRLIDAFCSRGEQYPIEAYDHLLFSFHGLPERQLRKSDVKGNCLSPNCCSQGCNLSCYKAQCFATAKAIASQLNLSQEHYTICFQSRLGREPWIQPYASDVLHARAKAGDRRLLVFSPSFVCDCLETIFEISSEYKEEFLKLGGEELQLVEGLNGHPIWIDALKQIIQNSAPKEGD